MSILRTIPEADADATTAAMYDDDIADQGFVAAHTKVMALNPAAYAAWEALIGEIARPLGLRRYELVTLAAARGTRSRHCRLAHGRRSLSLFEEDQLVRIAADYRDAGLSPAEVAMMAYAERVGRDSDRMTDADSLTLRQHGFSDREILDITLAAAARNYYSRAIQALAVEVDVPEDIGPELRDALLRGL
ncbi:carboxymuconolactone decarboxylase family protein [Plantibacter sp. 2H11-2]|uniref:carboxymuconolactone decarboxylase family protein n=1 Tax=Plantibacter sp. 2H11-2 TaxID=3414431 RepID=UPI003CE74BF6